MPRAVPRGLAPLGAGSSSRARPAALRGARCPAVPGAGPITHRTGQALSAAPDVDPATETSARTPSRSWQMSSAERKGLGDSGDFPARGGKKKKRRKKKEGGCPSQLIAAWHLCPRAGVQARREQARCHRSRWARRQAAPSPQSCRSSGRGVVV